jgi:NAD(P)-dependent dehydrogenase (short-subunit alcohol dehydrogenase family)
MTQPSVLITGVGRGLGHGLLVAMALERWRVVGTMRNGTAECWEALETRVRPFVTLHTADLSDPAACQALASEITEPLDILINCAASFGGEAFHVDHFKPDAFLETLAVNVVAPSLLSLALKPCLMLGRHKLIIMMSTGNASITANVSGGMLAYRASKSALRA